MYKNTQYSKKCDWRDKNKVLCLLQIRRESQEKAAFLRELIFDLDFERWDAVQ